MQTSQSEFLLLNNNRTFGQDYWISAGKRAEKVSSSGQRIALLLGLAGTPACGMLLENPNKHLANNHLLTTSAV